MSTAAPQSESPDVEPRKAAAFEQPASVTDRLRNEFERLLTAAWEQGGKAADALGLKNLADRGIVPPVSLVESTEEITVWIDLPGVSAADTEVLLRGNMLTVKGLRRSEPPPVGAHVHRRECASGALERVIPLPAAVDAERVSADSRDGVLTVRFKKIVPEAPRRILVGASAGSVSP
jgi:HSP20 family protein